MPNQAIKENLQRFLHLVKNPGRYIGGEANQIVKDTSGTLASMLLLFPDSYELGMSHNGTKVLYHVLNREPDLSAERAFAPMPDMAALLKERGLPLYSLESYRPVKDFTAVGISLQTELNYTNVPYVLELGGLHAFSRDRREQDPLVIGGGPCMANPEPVADFFDLFVIGDGEVLAPRILRHLGLARRAGRSKAEMLRDLSALPGVYVPSLLELALSPHGEKVPAFDGSQGPYSRAKGVRRAWVEVLDRDDYPVRNLMPHMKLVHDRYSVEVMRGCTQGCRFCQAGYWYRPNRELNPDDVVDLAKEGLRATGERELGLLSLSTADYGPVEKVVDALMDDSDFTELNLSLPSLRANSFGQGLARKVAALAGGKSATFAPETGSERLRRMINKTISDRDMYDAAESVFSSGFRSIKLYTMVGLPTENLEDMRAFCGLIENLSAIGLRHGKRNMVHANIGILVPKPFTPMQWVGFMERDKVMDHIRFVRDSFRGNRNVRITWADYGLSHVEAFYSRGDRSLSELIYRAYLRGMTFESFTEHFRYDGWRQLWAEAGYPQSRIYRERDLREVFPWDFIHAGVNKGYLKLEYGKMFTESGPVPDCKWGDCQKCGIPGIGADTKLAPMPERHRAPARTPEEIKALAAARRRQTGAHAYRLVYRKSGLARFIAHQNTLELFERALRRERLRLAYSQGFNTRPVIKNAGALPLGLESRCELLVVELREPLPPDARSLCERLSSKLPEGLDLVSIEPAQSARLPRIDSVTYALSPGGVSPEALEKAAAAFRLGLLPGRVMHRDREVDVGEEILEAGMEQGALTLRLRTHPSGSTLSPYAVFGALLGVDAEDLRGETLAKIAYTLAESRMAAVKGNS